MRSVFVGLRAVFLAASLAGMAVTTVAAQQPAEPAPLSAYGALPSLEFVELSPSGRRLACVTVVGEQRLLVLLDLSTGRQLASIGIGSAKIRDLDWAGEERVVITTSTTESMPELGIIRRELYIGQIYDIGSRRIFGMLTGTTSLFPALGSPAEVVHSESPFILARAFAFDNPARLSLYRVDPANGRARLAETFDRDVDGYVLGPSGQAVARSQYDSRTGDWLLELRQGDRFTENWRTTAPLDIPGLIGLGMTGESVIVSADRPDLSREGREDAAFFDVNLATGVWRPVRFEFAPHGLMFHPVTRRMIGAARTNDDGPVYAFSDQDAGLLWANVEQAFPEGAPDLISWSDDLQTAVVFTSGSNDSGSYHLVDLKEGAVTPVGDAYKAITPDLVAPISTLTYTAADGLEIHGYLTVPRGREAKDLPLVVLAHGGPASRDSMGFDWWAQALASRGYAVLQANFRGSTGYGPDFMEAGYGEWGRKMQTDLSDGVRHLAEQGVIDPERVCIVGASYGGYAALAGPTLDRGVYRCAVSVAGVSDLRRMVEHEASEGARRENETVRYWNRFMGAERLGDRSLDERSPARLAEQADAPILLIHGKDDTVVPVEQSRMMAGALRRAGKPFELIELTGEDHNLSRTETRLQMLEATVRFLQANNPAD